jgi:putative ABC transport system permease protein
VVLVALVAIVISGGSLLAYSLINGIESTESRLGADAMFVPLGAEQDIQGALLQGEPGSFYIEGTVAENLLHAEGVAQASPQLFIATFDSSHCAFPAQIIGYDPSTDFVISPWLSKEIDARLEYGEVIVGNGVSRDAGDELLMFNKLYNVVGRLDKTGMGFDNAVFINMETARSVVADYSTFEEAVTVPEGEGVASVVMVKIKDGFDPEKFAKNVRDVFRADGIGVVLPKAMIDDLSANLNFSLTLLAILVAALWALSISVLAIVFTIALHSRTREFGVLRAIGATRRKLAGIVLSESFLIGLGGAGIGIGLLCLVLFPFRSLITDSFNTAFLFPSALGSALILAAAFALSLSMGPLAAVYAAIRIGRQETFSILRENG